MIKRYLNIFISLLLLSLHFYYPSPAEGKWLQNGTSVTKGGIASRMYPSITGTGDGSGGAFVAWEDLSVNPGDIYVQKIDVNGTPLFDSDKDATVDNSASKQYPAIVNDDSGGAFVVWEDSRNGINTDIYIQKIDGSGNRVWSVDKAVCSASGNQWNPRIALTGDNTGDIIVAWEDHRTTTSQIYAQRINTSGDPVWALNGIIIAASSGSQFSPAISSDGYDGAVVVWEDQRNISTTGSDIYAQRISSSGAGEWTSDKIAVTNAAGDQWFPAIATDGQNNFIITWEDYRIDDIFSDIYAKGVNYDGLTLFGDKAICSITAERKDSRHPVIAYSTSEGSFIIAWEDYRNDPNYTSDIYAQKINSAGNLFWTTNGVAASTPNDYQEAVSLASSDNRGVIAAWQDIRSETDYEIYSIPLPIPGYIAINGDATSTTDVNVDLALSAVNIGTTITHMRLRNDDPNWPNDTDGWETYSTIKADWAITSAEGVKKVYAQFKDGGGNISPAYFDDIALSYVPIGSITITEVYNSSTTKYTDSTSVSLVISAVNAAQMCISNTTTCSTWETYATSKTWTLTSADGQKTVYVRFKDQYGNISSTYYSDAITLDRTGPTGNSIVITSPLTVKDGISYTNSQTVTIALDATDALSGVARAILSNNNTTSWGNHVAYAATVEWNLNYPYPGDGTKKVYAKFMDNVNYARFLVDDRYPVKWGNTIVSNSVILDTTAPSGSISITGSGGITGYTNSSIVNLTLSATDSSSGIDKMRFSNNNSTWSSWEAYNTNKSWTLSTGDGTKAVYVQFKDVAGNSATYSANIILDTTGPTGSISINSGAEFTTSVGVTLALSATDATSNSTQIQMRFSNSNSSWSDWEAYGTSKTWDIPAGDGMKAVYVQFKDNLENTSASYSDSITLDTGTPTAGSVIINDDAPYTATTAVTLTLSAIDPNLSQMQFSNGNSTWSAWGNYSTTKDWTLDNNGDGLKTVYVQFKDSAGNVSQPYSDDITLDTAPPTGAISINSDATYTNSTSVTLSISCTDSGSGCSLMQFSNDNSIWSTSEAYATVKNWDISSTDGIKTVYVKFEDNAGKWSTSEIKDTISLDTTPPAVASTTPANGANGISASSTITIIFSEKVVDATSSILLKQGEEIIDSAVAYDDSAKTATLTPSASLSEYTAYTIVVTTNIRDLASNQMPSSYTFNFTTADVTKPSSTILTPSNGAIIGNASAYTITGAASDSGSGVSKVEVSTNGGSTWDNATGTSSWTYSWTLPADGSYTIKTRATDTAGMVQSLLTSITVTVDNTAPASSASPAGGTYMTAQSVELNATDAAATTIYYTTDGTTPTTASSAYSSPIAIAKNTTLKFFAVDSAGNTEGIKTEAYILDVTAPATTASVASGLYNSDISVTLSCDDNSGSGCDKTFYCLGTGCDPTTEYTGSAIGITSPTTLKFFSKDLNTNTESTKSATYTIDKTAPEGSITIVSGVMSNDVNYYNSTAIDVTLSASDVGSSVSKMRFSTAPDTWKENWEIYSESKTLTINSSGETKISVYVQFKDAAGNISTTYMDEFVLDTTPPDAEEGVIPTVSLNGAVMAPDGTGYSYSYSKVAASWTPLSDAQSGLKEYLFAIGTTPGETDMTNGWISTNELSYTTGDISSDYFGTTLYISVKAMDNLGYASDVLSVSFVYTPADINSKSGTGDGRVDGFDLGKLGIAFGAMKGDPNWDTLKKADINMDDIVDGSDLTTLGVNFGKVRQ